MTIRNTKPQKKFIEIIEQNNLNPLNVSATVDEAYQIQISSHHITVLARTNTGMFYAYQTLKKLHQGERSLPLCEIKDQPRLQGNALGYRSKLLFKRGDFENSGDDGDVQVEQISFSFDGGRGLEVGNPWDTRAYRGTSDVVKLCTAKLVYCEFQGP